MHEWFAATEGLFCYQNNGPGILTSVQGKALFQRHRRRDGIYICIYSYTLFINSMIQYVAHMCMVCIVICCNQDAKLTTWRTESGKPIGSHISAKDSLFLRQGGAMPMCLRNFMWTNVCVWTHNNVHNVKLLSFWICEQFKRQKIECTVYACITRRRMKQGAQQVNVRLS